MSSASLRINSQHITRSDGEELRQLLLDHFNLELAESDATNPKGRDLVDLALISTDMREFRATVQDLFVRPSGPRKLAWLLAVARLYDLLNDKAEVQERRPASVVGQLHKRGVSEDGTVVAQSVQADDSWSAQQLFPASMLPQLRFGVLNLSSGDVVSVEFKSIAGPRLPLDEFVERVAQVGEDERALVHTLDASRVALCSDADLALVKRLAELLPKCAIIDLTHNRLMPTHAAAVEELLRVEHVRYVVITTNPLASIDSKEWFGSLAEDQILRIIWVPKSWLAAGRWKAVCAREEVTKAHTQYYHEYA